MGCGVGGHRQPAAEDDFFFSVRVPRAHLCGYFAAFQNKINSQLEEAKNQNNNNKQTNKQKKERAKAAAPRSLLNNGAVTAACCQLDERGGELSK